MRKEEINSLIDEIKCTLARAGYNCFLIRDNKLLVMKGFEPAAPGNKAVYTFVRFVIIRNDRIVISKGEYAYNEADNQRDLEVKILQEFQAERRQVTKLKAIAYVALPVNYKKQMEG